jgi:dephospho-CoA kinase
MVYRHAVALTGGIATGKSTVASLMSLYGFHVIDADRIAHGVLERKTDTIVKHFGCEILTSCGAIDRKILGEKIFTDEDKRQALEAVIHPAVREEISRLAGEQEKFGKPYLIDIPLFFETESYDIKYSVLVYAPQKFQLERLMERDGFSEKDAKNRISAQMDIEEKRRKATWVIDNTGDLSHLADECEKVRKMILATF